VTSWPFHITIGSVRCDSIRCRGAFKFEFGNFKSNFGCAKCQKQGRNLLEKAEKKKAGDDREIHAISRMWFSRVAVVDVAVVACCLACYGAQIWATSRESCDLPCIYFTIPIPNPVPIPSQSQSEIQIAIPNSRPTAVTSPNSNVITKGANLSSSIFS